MTFSYCRNIYLSDTDAAGVIYFAQGLVICHEAYEEWLQSIGLSVSQILQKQTIALPIVHAEIDFLKPIKCGDRINIQLEVKDLKTTQFKINYTIFKLKSLDKPLAKASTIHVCINPQTRKKVTLPDVIMKSAINNY